ncbi:MOSC domain-containing protein [Haloarcula marina]|uniref:MOSC domain-containing protein n=1 Tax=Haloarcula marina TaxID=2961574 RepID=UPI0020B6F4E1|nr:MOSC domain-containing protein [Halomicroarcula marina]
MHGEVTAIHLARDSGGTVEPAESADAVAERGLRGDRYFRDQGTFDDRSGSDLTLIEAEALSAVEDDYGVSIGAGEHRRNVTTEGVALNHLVGQRFAVGGAVCVGEELCEPCAYLEDLLDEAGVREALVHRGGLRARIVESGTIATGDAVETASV